MNETKTLPVTDTLESLDFEPSCDACDLAATWYAELVCGCASYLGCDKHAAHDQRVCNDAYSITCDQCGMTKPGTEMIVWRRL